MDPAPNPADRPDFDLFCRVIDNHGDLGVVLRLARALARRGRSVRFWLDDGRALAWMAPDGPGVGIALRAWTAGADDVPGPAVTPAHCVIETFGCDPPPAFVARMAAVRPAPVWLNLEYLTAEAFAARDHGLPSPVWHGPGAGLVKRFAYPGYDAATGGLLKDIGAQAQALREASPAIRRAWLEQQGWIDPHAAPARVVSVFGYPNPRLRPWLAALARTHGPLHLLTSPGPATEQLEGFGAPGVTQRALTWLDSDRHDALLAAADLNLVRGEDTWVRAQWVSAAPMLWQAYPQHDGAHAAKVRAFAQRLAEGDPALRACFDHFNGLDDHPLPPPSPPPWDRWRALQASWRGQLATLPELADSLLTFAGLE